MPNWCYTTVSFKGKPENIFKLVNDIYDTMSWTRENNYNYCNIGYFLSLSGFNIDSYNNDPNTVSIKQKCSITYNYPFKIEHYGSYAMIYPIFESAWSMDHNILYLIAALYHVEFSSYSEEPNMGYFVKCKNGIEDTYDYDAVLSLDQNKVDEEWANDKDCILDYYMPVKSFDNHTEYLLDVIDKKGIEYKEIKIPEYDEGSSIRGIYYE